MGRDLILCLEAISWLVCGRGDEILRESFRPSVARLTSNPQLTLANFVFLKMAGNLAYSGAITLHGPQVSCASAEGSESGS